MNEMLRRETPQSAGDFESPSSWTTFKIMEELLDKLKLLNYDSEFINNLKMKPLNRHYFALQTNSGEQFYLFTSLAAWLIRKTGRPFEQPQEYDDPNSTIAGILDSLRVIGIAVDFPPNKLKQGYGDQAVYVLDKLADVALRTVNFKWQKPQPPVEDNSEEPEIEDESELVLEKIEEEMAIDFSDDDEDNLLRIDDLRNIHVAERSIRELQKPENILESNTDLEAWKLELERVLPQLKVTIQTESRDWRSHLEQMQKHRSGIDESLNLAQGQLDKLHKEITQTLEKINSREKYLNSHLEPLLVQYRSIQDQYSKVSEQYKDVSSGVTERSQILAKVTEELETVKQEMEERGSSMTDGTPLVNIKKAISKLKNEITAMDIRIGVLEHSILQAKVRDKTLLQQDMNSISSFIIA